MHTLTDFHHSVGTLWYSPSGMASTYTKGRLQSTLKVFRQARDDAAKVNTSCKLQRLRGEKRRREVDASDHLPHSSTWNDDDAASSDDYTPETPKKRRLAVPRMPKSKRLKPDPQPQIANHNHTTSETVSAVPTPGLVTLKLRSAPGRIILNALAGQYGTGYEKQTSDESDDTTAANGGRRSSKTYLEKQDEESGKIGERTTRSGLRRKITRSAKVPAYNPTDPFNVSKNVQAPLTLPPANAQPTPSPSPAGPRPIDVIRACFAEYHATGMEDNPIVLDSPSPTPTPEPDARPKPYTFTITTAWGHPINFKHDASSGLPCHFCNDFRYGVFGYGLIETKIYRDLQGTQFQEAEDGHGHRSRGKEATRMCVKCSLKRLYISSCEVHSITQFIVPDTIRFNTYIAQLLDKRYPKGPALKCGVYYTCSLCTQPAFWRCVADQIRDRKRQSLSKEQGKGRGCGLILCHSCAGNLRRDGGILKDTTVKKPKDHDCRRADMDFLFPGSLLHKMYK